MNVVFGKKKQFQTEIDEQDLDLLTGSPYVSDKGYVYIMYKSRSRKALHRLVLERIVGRSLSSKEQCDHKDHNTLNNKRDNLRIATNQENGRNRHKRIQNPDSPSFSKYKGVEYRHDGQRKKRWRAKYYVDSKGIMIGHFLTELEAAQAYDIAVKQQFGEFAKTNF